MREGPPQTPPQLSMFDALDPVLEEPKVEAPAPDWRTQVPSVSQITRRIRGHVEGTFQDVWVRGEVSNFRKPISGHGYFILKDATSQMRGVMFKNQLSKVKFNLEDGMELLAHGSITVYEARGEYQLVCDTMEPVGAGALQLAFEQLKKKLQKEGLFEAIHKKPLPYLPKRIGIVTSKTGAAVKDILKVLHRRYPDREVLIFPASVQGDKAAPEICAALDRAVQWNVQHPDREIEVLIVGRGGGSLEDMWCFNEESVARAIFKCPIPIISAVGHEIDTTIADFVADLRAPTPSAAAEMVVPRKDELQRLVDHHTQRLTSVLKRQLQQLRLHTGHLGRRLIDPRQKIKKLQETVTRIRSAMMAAIRTRVLLQRRRLESKAQLLHSLSPLQILGRGYSLTKTEDGKIVSSVKDLTTGQVVLTKLGEGEFTSRVETVAPKSS